MITNGYCTLAELKARLIQGAYAYTATTISFASATKKIADTALGLGMFATARRITVSGSTDNDGTYTIATGGVAAEIVTSQALTTEAAGDVVTIVDVTDVQDDAKLEQVIEGISRAIDQHCKRRFYSTAEDEKRYYTAIYSDRLYPGDVLSVTTLKTDDGGDGTYENSWTEDTDFYLEPFNATLDGQPYTKISQVASGSYSFPVKVKKGVEIDGKFGYASTTPDNIREACLLMAARLFKRKDAVFGIVGSPEMGVLRQILRDDPEIQALLYGMRRLE